MKLRNKFSYTAKSAVHFGQRLEFAMTSKSPLPLNRKKLRKLQTENAELKTENEILKKAAAYVCHEVTS